MKGKKNSHRPGFLEKWGKAVLYSLDQKKSKIQTSYQQSFQSNSQKLIARGTLNSFLIGFIPSYLFVWISIKLPTLFEIYGIDTNLHYVIIILLITIFTFIEFYLLFKVGLYEAFKMAELANLELIDEPELITPVPGMLARIALEIPDPELSLFGIDPYKRSNRKTIFLKSIMYKLKVLVSNLAAKVILKAILGRSTLRLYVEFIAAPITGIWDAYVTFKILSELRMRIISRKIAEKIIILVKEKQNNFSEIGRETIIRAIANSIVFTKTFHPNFEYLLLKLVKELNVNLSFDELDDAERFKLSLGRCSPFEIKIIFNLFLIGSCFDGKLTEEENAFIPSLFQGFTDIDAENITSLAKLIHHGYLIESLQLVEKMTK